MLWILDGDIKGNRGGDRTGHKIGHFVLPILVLMERPNYPIKEILPDTKLAIKEMTTGLPSLIKEIFPANLVTPPRGIFRILNGENWNIWNGENWNTYYHTFIQFPMEFHHDSL